MTDTLYTYIPGQGWIPSNSPKFYSGRFNGVNVTIYDRAPEVGECGMYLNGDSRDPQEAYNHLMRFPEELWRCRVRDEGAFTVEIDGDTKWRWDLYEHPL